MEAKVISRNEPNSNCKLKFEFSFEFVCYDGDSTSLTSSLDGSRPDYAIS